MVEKAKEIMESKKGDDIRLFDVRGKSAITDYILVVSGLSSPHLKALYSEILAVLKKDCGVNCFRKAGDPEGGWLVLDYIDVIIHIFLPERREYYAIEELWENPPEDL